MSRDTLSAKRLPVRLFLISMACLVPPACSSVEDAAGPGDGQTDGPGGPNPTVSAEVVISDGSGTGGLTGADAIDGQIHLTGLTLEISEDGEKWITVTTQPATVKLALGDPAGVAKLPPLEIPVGDYATARITADEAVADISAMVNGQQFLAQIEPPVTPPIQIEKEIEVIVNEDGSRTIRVELETVRTFSLLVEPGSGVTIEIGGDLGNMAAMARTNATVVLGDVSRPAGVALDGEITLSGLTLELSQDGQTWLTLTDQPLDATLSLGAGVAELTLVPVSEIPAGDYQQARLTAGEAVIDLTVTINGHDFFAHIEPPVDGAVVIEKDIEVIVNEDGSITIRIEIEMIRTIDVQVQPGSGAVVVIDGDLGPVSVSATTPAPPSS